MIWGGTPAAVIWGTRSFWNVSAKIVPTNARATEPPICRKHVRFDVATPIWRNGTEFWITIVKTENVGRTPRPARNIQNQTIGSGVSLVSCVIRAVEPANSVIETNTSSLRE